MLGIPVSMSRGLWAGDGRLSGKEARCTRIDSSASLSTTAMSWPDGVGLDAGCVGFAADASGSSAKTALTSGAGGVPIRWSRLMVIGACVGAANAQDGLDAHGPVAPPSDGDPRDPLLGWRAGGLAAGEVSAGGLFEVGRNAMVLYSQSDVGEPPEKNALLGLFYGVNLGLAWGVHERFSVGLSAPLWFGSQGDPFENIATSGGPALGDVHLWAPVHLVLPASDGAGFGLSVVPYLDLPTGPAKRLLGDSVFAGGVSAVAGLRLGAFDANLNLGVEGRPQRELLNFRLGSGVRSSVALSWTPVELASLHAEARLYGNFGSSQDTRFSAETALTGVPVEVLGALRGRHDDSGVWYAVGVGTGVTPGVGAAALRAFAGVGWSLDKKAVDENPDVVTTPVASTPVRFAVYDVSGTPVAGAAVAVGGSVQGRTDSAGLAELPRKGIPWKRGVEVSASGFAPKVVELDLSATEPVNVELDFLKVTFALWVKDQEGNPVAADVRLDGPEATAIETNAEGRMAIDLAPGDWSVTVDSDGLGKQVRTLELEPGRGDSDTEVLMLPEAGDASLALSIRDPDGNPIDGAVVLLNGVPVGSTASGGTLTLGELAPGTVDIEILADTYQTTIREGVPVEGESALDLVLERQSGSVLILVRSPKGPVTDAAARFFGPSRFSTPIGRDGEKTLVLRPGSWQVLIASPTFGIQQRTVTIPEDHDGLITVDFMLQPSEGGLATLDLRVVDPSGEPVEGATIALDGREVGRTSTGGGVQLSGLEIGSRGLDVYGEWWRPTKDELLLVEGSQERTLTLPWKPGTVRIIARSDSGAVRDGAARFGGPGRLGPVELGADGEEYVRIAPEGRWQAVVSSSQFGLQQRSLELPPDSRELHDLIFSFSEPEGGDAKLTIQVVDPDGKPVDSAAVQLDGVPVGTTSNVGSVVIEGLQAGRRMVDVAAPLLLPASASIDVQSDVEETLALDWAEGTIRVFVRASDGPVSNAMLRFAGPTFRPSIPVADDGLRTLHLDPGTWQMLVSSPDYGLVQRAIEVPEGPGITDVEVVLSKPVSDVAEILVSVRDPDGEPVDNATVRIGSDEITARGGVAVVAGLPVAPIDIAVEAETFRGVALEGVALRSGTNERVIQLEWVPVPLSVTVQDDEGRPVDAEVRLDGPADIEPMQAGEDGEISISVRPGTWTVLASTEALGVGRETVTIAPGSEGVASTLELRKREVELTGTSLTIAQKVFFDLESATLKPESLAVLDEVANTLLASPKAVRVEIQGHSDTVGGVRFNFQLSSRRADAVRKALIDRGVPPERLASRGYGPSRPIASNETDEGRARNRRVEFEVVVREE